MKLNSGCKSLNIQNRETQQFSGVKLEELEQPETQINKQIEEEEEEGLVPISVLHPFRENWSIKSRVTRKSEVKQWSNSRGSGQVFNIDLIDKYGTEITCSFYNEAVDKFHSLLQKDKVYIFSDGRVQLNKNKQYTKNNEHTISFDNKCTICEDKSGDQINTSKLKATPLGQLKDTHGNVDIIGIIVDEGTIQQIQLKSGGTKQLRNITLIDQDKVLVQMSIWGQQAEDTTHFAKNNLLAVKDCYVSRYQDTYKLQQSHSSQFIWEVEHLLEARQLYKWYQTADLHQVDNNSLQTTHQSTNQLYKTLDQLDTLDNSINNNKVFSDVYVYLSMLRKDGQLYYLGCPECYRKVVEVGDGYMCNSCDKGDVQPICRYIFSAQFADQSGRLWMGVNNQVGEQLLGYPAQQFHHWKQINYTQEGYGPQAMQVLEEAKFQKIKCRVVSYYDSYNQETRLKHNIIKILPTDVEQESDWFHQYITTNYP